MGEHRDGPGVEDCDQRKRSVDREGGGCGRTRDSESRGTRLRRSSSSSCGGSVGHDRRGRACDATYIVSMQSLVACSCTPRDQLPRSVKSSALESDYANARSSKCERTLSSTLRQPLDGQTKRTSGRTRKVQVGLTVKIEDLRYRISVPGPRRSKGENVRRGRPGRRLPRRCPLSGSGTWGSARSLYDARLISASWNGYGKKGNDSSERCKASRNRSGCRANGRGGHYASRGQPGVE